MIVLMLNDYPIGVYTTRQAAENETGLDWKRREPSWNQEPKLKRGESRWAQGTTCVMWHYSFYDFVVNAEAQL